ncbi:MAG: alpha/beta hydrolase [Balneolaceae bacterium]|nr:alpha/beta hydrolase [Balneolaceae bacterium]
MKKQITVAAFILLVIGCTAETEQINTPNAVAELRPVTVGGMEQWLLIRGTDRTNPLLLWLHGGPGSAQMPIHHAYTRELEQEFVVVHWDQRGAGKSNPRNFKEVTMTLDRFIRDTHEVTRYLLKQFNRDKIYLLGHSWGTLLGMYTVERYPEDYHAFISVSQVVHTDRAAALSYNWLKKQVETNGTRQQKEEFRNLGPPPYRNHDRYVQFAKMIDAFGGGMDAGFPELLWKSLQAEEYTLTDYIRWFKGANRGSGPMWEETNDIDLFSEIPTVKVPLFFMTGRNDYNTPHQLVREYYAQLEAPLGKQLIPFDHSAHTPFIAEPKKFVQTLADIKNNRSSTAL